MYSKSCQNLRFSIASEYVSDFLFEGRKDKYSMDSSSHGGMLFWRTEEESPDFKLQVHSLNPTYARILDADNARVARGNSDVMRVKFRRLNSPNFLIPGDIIGVSRKNAGHLYQHYAVYVGNNEVIHYAPIDGAGDFNGVIHKAPFEEFLKDDDECFVLNFTNKPDCEWNSLLEECTKRSGNAHLFSPEETIKRAESRLGEDSYNLASNNCEHFAIWCKTGISESHQVNRVLNLFLPIRIPVRVSYDKIMYKP